MALGGLFELGRLSDVARTAYRALRASVLGGPRASSGAPDLAVSRGGGLESLRTAADSLKDAFQRVASKTRPVYATTLYTGQSSSAMLSGAAARVARVEGNSIVTTTVQVNTRSSTVRSSSSALGLDVVSAEAASGLSSSSGLGLDVVSAESASTIQSTAEMNTRFEMSYTSTLSFTGAGLASTSQANLTGTYTGANAAANASSLTVKMRNNDLTMNATVATNVKFDVLDQNNTVLFSFDGSLVSGQQVYLGDNLGLSLSFTPGTLRINHTATTTLTQTATPITVSGTAAFNAAIGTRPRFENNAVVTAGTFTVNGSTITVAANDTIDGVLTKINNSGAGVTAALADDKISLTTSGYSEDAIVLADDTSGFLAATKLSAAATTTGNVRDDQQVFKKTSQFASVADGAFTINGVSISVDKDTDSLTTLMDRINSSGAGVTASFNSATNKVELTTTANSEDLIAVAGDTSGFLAASGLSTNNTVRGNIQDDDQVFAKTTQFNDVVTGSFEINGVSTSVNKDADSLTTVLNRINSSGAGVTATYDSGADRVVITPDVAGATLTVGSDTSGFLSEAKIAAGTEATQANAAGAFNATGTGAPQFDSGLSVSAGSFTVNGVTINVAANDTIDSVLAKITASAADIDAAYDAATETITLTSRHFGADPIVLANDTSGFLAAVKLDGTVAETTGADASAFDLEIGEIDEYNAVTAGTLTINGQAIAIDPATTTVDALIAAINNLTNVTALVDEGGGGITINSAPGGTLTVSDTSGILTAFGLTAGTFTGVAGETTALKTQAGTAPANTPDVVLDISKATDALNAALVALHAGRSGDTAFTGAMKDGLQAFVTALESAGVAGVSVSAADEAAPSLTLDRDALEKAIDALARPGEARTGMANAVTALAAAIESAAARAQPAGPAAAEARRSWVTIQLAQMPHVSAARPAAARAGAYKRQSDEAGSTRSRTFEERPRVTGRYSDPVNVTPIDQTGLFEGLVDNLLKRLT